MKHSRLKLVRPLVVGLVVLVWILPVMAGDLPPVLSPVALPAIPTNVVNIADYGKGDGQTLNTTAFEKALAALSERGGGKLMVPPGIWLTGPIRLRSNIDLHVERGALIQFSGDYKLYPLTIINVRGEKDVDSTPPIFGQNLENVAVTGEGIIDGGGDAWRMIKKAKLTEGDWKSLVKSGGVLNEKGDTWWPSKAAMDGAKAVPELQKKGSLNLTDYGPYHQYFRARMVRLIDCKKVLIQGVTIQNPPNWTIHPQLCEDVSIFDVQVRNSPVAQNSDALDLESCRRAIIRGCVFDTGDDGICIKSGLNAAGRRIGVPTEDVLVENCVVYRAHGGFTIGSEMSGGVRNMIVRNCLFMGTDIGLRFKTARGRGGVVENIHIQNINMFDIPGDAINFSMSYGGKAPLDAATGTVETNLPPVTEETPAFREIHIESLVCRGAKNAIMLQGLPEMPLRNITLKDVSITAQNSGLVIDAENISFQNVEVISQPGTSLKTIRVRDSKLVLKGSGRQ